MFQSISFAISYLVRPSPFSAQKTFERHNSRRKSNISFCSNINMAQAAAAAAGSRRGSGFNINTLQGVTPMAGYGSQRAPFVTTKSNSLSLPDSPASVVGQTRARSNSLRVIIAHTLLLTDVQRVFILNFPAFRLTMIFCCDDRTRCDRAYQMWAYPVVGSRH